MNYDKLKEVKEKYLNNLNFNNNFCFNVNGENTVLIFNKIDLVKNNVYVKKNNKIPFLKNKLKNYFYYHSLSDIESFIFYNNNFIYTTNNIENSILKDENDTIFEEYQRSGEMTEEQSKRLFKENYNNKDLHKLKYKEKKAGDETYKGISDEKLSKFCKEMYYHNIKNFIKSALNIRDFTNTFDLKKLENSTGLSSHNFDFYNKPDAFKDNNALKKMIEHILLNERINPYYDEKEDDKKEKEITNVFQLADKNIYEMFDYKCAFESLKYFIDLFSTLCNILKSKHYKNNKSIEICSRLLQKVKQMFEIFNQKILQLEIIQNNHIHTLENEIINGQILEKIEKIKKNHLYEKKIIKLNTGFFFIKDDYGNTRYNPIGAVPGNLNSNDLKTDFISDKKFFSCGYETCKICARKYNFIKTFVEKNFEEIDTTKDSIKDSIKDLIEQKKKNNYNFFINYQKSELEKKNLELPHNVDLNLEFLKFYFYYEIYQELFNLMFFTCCDKKQEDLKKKIKEIKDDYYENNKDELNKFLGGALTLPKEKGIEYFFYNLFSSSLEEKLNFSPTGAPASATAPTGAPASTAAASAAAAPAAAAPKPLSHVIIYNTFQNNFNDVMLNMFMSDDIYECQKCYFDFKSIDESGDDVKNIDFFLITLMVKETKKKKMKKIHNDNKLLAFLNMYLVIYIPDITYYYPNEDFDTITQIITGHCVKINCEPFLINYYDIYGDESDGEIKKFLKEYEENIFFIDIYKYHLFMEKIKKIKKIKNQKKIKIIKYYEYKENLKHIPTFCISNKNDTYNFNIKNHLVNSESIKHIHSLKFKTLIDIYPEKKYHTYDLSDEYNFSFFKELQTNNDIMNFKKFYKSYTIRGILIPVNFANTDNFRITIQDNEEKVKNIIKKKINFCYTEDGESSSKAKYWNLEPKPTQAEAQVAESTNGILKLYIDKYQKIIEDGERNKLFEDLEYEEFSWWEYFYSFVKKTDEVEKDKKKEDEKKEKIKGAIETKAKELYKVNNEIKDVTNMWILENDIYKSNLGDFDKYIKDITNIKLPEEKIYSYINLEELFYFLISFYDNKNSKEGKVFIFYNENEKKIKYFVFILFFHDFQTDTSYFTILNSFENIKNMDFVFINITEIISEIKKNINLDNFITENYNFNKLFTILYKIFDNSSYSQYEEIVFFNIKFDDKDILTMLDNEENEIIELNDYYQAIIINSFNFNSFEIEYYPRKP